MSSSLKKYALLIFLLLFKVTTSFAAIYCPQALKCTYAQGCKVTDPIPYNYSSYIYPSFNDFTETTYNFNSAIDNDGFGFINCFYTPASGSLNAVISSSSVSHTNEIVPNNWKRTSDKGYTCKGFANDCPFKAISFK